MPNEKNKTKKLTTASGRANMQLGMGVAMGLGVDVGAMMEGMKHTAMA